jgi:hypothetical protein
MAMTYCAALPPEAYTHPAAQPTTPELLPGRRRYPLQGKRLRNETAGVYNIPDAGAVLPEEKESTQ